MRKTKKFAGKELSNMLDRLGERPKQIKSGAKELFIVNDKDGTPTYTHDFANTVKELIKYEYWGLYNVVCGGQTSRFEVAVTLVEMLELSYDIKITPVTSDYFQEEYFAARPASERLLTKKLDLRKINKMRDWRVSLKEYLENYYSGYLNK